MSNAPQIASKVASNRAGMALDFFQRGGGDSLTSLLENIRKDGFSIRQIARALSINQSDVFYFIRNKTSRVGKQRRRLIRDFFIKQGWLPTPKPALRCTCPICGKTHVQKKGALTPVVSRLLDAADAMFALRDKMLLSPTTENKNAYSKAVDEITKALEKFDSCSRRSSTQE